MKEYIKLDDSDEVIRYGRLPKSEVANGKRYFNLHTLTDVELKELFNLVPADREIATINQAIEKLSDVSVVVASDKLSGVIKQTAIAKSYEEKLDYCRQMRKSEYPPFEDYLDAKVKQSSSDSNVVEEGLVQEEEYHQACLAVKAKYPKPIE
jgi:hypothetical protein